MAVVGRKTVDPVERKYFMETDDESAAKLLLSVSPVLRPQKAPSLEDLRKLDPLESLADLAALEAPVTVVKQEMSKTLQALDLELGNPTVSLQSSSTCPSVLGHKYEKIYNRGGRIGIYTKKERQAIIDKYLYKKERRVWKKTVRYGCRKNLAEKRIRIKGRFVKVDPNFPLRADEAYRTKSEEQTTPGKSPRDEKFFLLEQRERKRPRRHSCDL